MRAWRPDRWCVGVICSLFLVAAACAAEADFSPGGRLPWTTSRVVGTPEPPPPYQIEQVFPLQFDRPVELTHAPGVDRLFMVELGGKIHSFPVDGDPQQADVFLDLTAIAGFRRAYGLEFSPDFASNREVYVCYVVDEGDPHGTRVSRFKVQAGEPPRCDPASEEVLITWYSGGHNGGCLKFGPDGYLYISTGDGSGPFPPDQQDSGQDISDLLASVLRIDVRAPGEGTLYRVPSDNPFVDTAGAAPEVWAYGFRNPWKMSFDPQGNLWVGDVGWELWEMIYRVERGGNYGWSVMEGRQQVRPEAKRGPSPILPPIVDHAHTEARSITGGYVYRGQRLPQLAGVYVYADYETGKIWGLRYEEEKLTWQGELANTPLKVITFGEDRHGELYVMDYAGTIHRLVPSTLKGNPDFPKRLSETGLFTSQGQRRPAPGVLPYSVIAEPWSDFATAERFIALPGSARIGTSPLRNREDWEFPPGTVLTKELSLEMERGNPASRRRMETQLLHFEEGMWRAYTYAWNDEQTEAVLVDALGMDRELEVRDPQAPDGVRRQTWRFASRAECLLCHNFKANSVLGFTPLQIRRDRNLASSGDCSLETLERIGLFEQPVPSVAPVVDPADTSAGLNERARSYLHANCSHCHRRGGGGNSVVEIPYDLKLEKTNALGARPALGAFGIAAAEIIAPGEPYRSVLLYRMATVGGGHMPRAGATLIDPAGVQLIRDWIEQLPPTSGIAGQPPRRAIEKASLETLERLCGDGLPDQSRQDGVDRLLAGTSSALMLLSALHEGKLPEPVRQEVIARGGLHDDPQVRGLFERFLPEDQRIQRLGTVIRPEEILSLAGDPQRGKQLFLEGKAAQCKNCHRIGGVGDELGPDLDQIGRKYPPTTMLETIFEPSKTIEPKYVPHLLETSGGQIYMGLLVSKSDGEVVLKDGQRKLVRVPAAEIELLVPQQKSLMPELLLRDMTAQQVADLLAYLGSLK